MEYLKATKPSVYSTQSESIRTENILHMRKNKHLGGDPGFKDLDSLESIHLPFLNTNYYSSSLTVAFVIMKQTKLGNTQMVPPCKYCFYKTKFVMSNKGSQNKFRN